MEDEGDFFFSSRRRHTRWNCDWSSDVCSSDLAVRFAATRPQRVAKLVLVDGGLDVRHEIIESLRPAINRLGVEFPSLDIFMGFVRALPMFEGRWNDYLERYFRYDVKS